MATEIKYPQYAIYTNPRALGDDTQLVLVVIVDSGSLPCASIFDSKTDLTSFTEGRGSYFASFLAKNEEEYNLQLTLFEEALIEYTNNFNRESNKVKDKIRKITPRPAPTQQS